MLNSLVLRALSGIMAINMAAAPVSTQGLNDVVNSRYYGTYETHLPGGGKIIIDSNGCKLEDFFLGNSSLPYPNITTNSYTRVYTINISEFSASYSPSQYVYVSSTGATKTPAKDDTLTVTGKVEERDEEFAPPRRYIISNGLSYWKNL